MPLRSVIIEEMRLVITQAYGILQPADLAENRASLVADPMFDPTYDHLFDLRPVERLDFTADDVEAATLVRAFSAASRRAIVAPRDLAFGLSRMYESHRNDLDEGMAVYRTFDEALAWLGRDSTHPALKRAMETTPQGV